ncbi:tetratricopeptide repeat protein [Lacibacter luteus]|uniref:Tetratricopeptide repeat protein n=1 Tax=Lacibacter luteus TaxID=2508719 RepID=A0A4Q1CIV4_9BACT|nr:tetratricopeptide repeat protein [Lacibacter luteus]
MTAVFLLFFFGRTVPKTQADDHAGHDHSKTAAPPAANTGNVVLDFPTMLGLAKKRLNASQLQKVTEWENSVVRGDVKNQQIKVYRTMSAFWMDTIGAFVPYAKYLGEAAKLENSEKNLTFAAHLFLREAQAVSEQPLQVWLAKEAKELFEKALAVNPANDSTKVGLGSTYFFGGAGNEPPMKGIALIREVTEKDPDNRFAQYMLGVGATFSGQLPKAIERFEKVLTLEPQNLELILRLADTYEKSGDKANAKKKYELFLQTVKSLETQGKFKSNPEMLKQIEDHIKLL